MPQPYPHGELVVVIDCSELDRSAAFWSAVLGYTASPAATGPYRSLEPESGAGIDVLLQRVPDVKAEVGRVIDLGARLLTREPVTEDGWSWHILADPDGNEFCVLQPPGMPSA